MSQLYQFDSYRLDSERRLLWRGKEVVQLPPKALETLVVLVKKHPDVVSKDDLMKAVWPDTFVEEANLSQNIFVLRKTLGETVRENRYIRTVPGRGYSFVAPVRAIAEPEDAAEPSVPDSAVAAPDGVTEDEREMRPPMFARAKKFISDRKVALFILPAIAIIILVIALLPSAARYYNNRGVRLQHEGNVQAAIQNYKRALSLSPSYAAAHYNLADAYEEIPDYGKAISEYQRAINADLTFYEAYNDLARLYILREKDYGSALRSLDRALSLKPKESSVQYSLYKNYGWANLELRNFGQSEHDLRLAMGLEPDRGAAHCLLAKVLELQGKTGDALSEWESCAAASNQPDTEPEWRNEAQERLRAEGAK